MITRLLQAAKRMTARQTVEEANFGLKAGIGTHIRRPLRVEGKQYIQFGDYCETGFQCWFGAYDSYKFSNQTFTPQISIGNHVFIGDSAIITAINKIIIEDGVEISHHVYISDHVHSINPEENTPMCKRRLVSKGYVKIGAYTGVGIRSVIAQGVTIGKYCIVAPNSVVTRSFPDYSNIRGNPAVLAKTFSLELRKWVDGMRQPNLNTAWAEIRLCRSSSPRYTYFPSIILSNLKALTI
jgi:acetyltransferase-like isoleucine patch superfamily enzyme